MVQIRWHLLMSIRNVELPSNVRLATPAGFETIKHYRICLANARLWRWRIRVIFEKKGKFAP